MANYMTTSVFTADSDASNSLKGITTQADQDVCYVQSTNRYYRWFAASTETANGTTVIIPDGQSAGSPGRWLIQGPPGPAAIIPDFPAIIARGNAGGLPILFSWQFDPTSPYDTFSWDVFSEQPNLLDGIYMAELRILSDGDAGDYSISGKAVFRVRIASGAVVAVSPAVFDGDVSGGKTLNFYGGPGGTGGVSGTLALAAGNINATVAYGGADFGVYCRLVFLDRVDI